MSPVVPQAPPDGSAPAASARTSQTKSIPRLLIVPSLLMLGVAVGLGFSVVRLRGALGRLHDVEENRHLTLQLAGELRQSSDDLTRMARTFASTGDVRFRDYFHRILEIRDGKRPRPEAYGRIYWDFVTGDHRFPVGAEGPAVPLDARMRAAGFTAEELALLEQAHARSDALVDLEEQAFDAMDGWFRGPDGARFRGAPDPALARSLVHGEAYHAAKAGIMGPIDAFLGSIAERTARATHDAEAAAARAFDVTVGLIAAAGAIALGLFLFQLHLGRSLVIALAEEVGERTALLTAANQDLRAAKEGLERSLAEVRTLEGLLQMCAWCKRIKDEKAGWLRVEAYVSVHTEAEFTHGLCPDCLHERFPGV